MSATITGGAKLIYDDTPIAAPGGIVSGRVRDIVTSMLPSEELVLMGLGFRRVYFSELHCKDHGEIRIGTETAPRHRHPCPICNRSCLADKILCTSYSKRSLPFYEIVSGPVLLRRLAHARYVASSKGAQRAAIIG